MSSKKSLTDEIAEELEQSPGEEKDGKNRRGLRVEVRESIEVELNKSSESNFYTGFVENISNGGLFVATHFPMEKGCEVPLKFTLPTRPGMEIQTTGYVRWKRDYDPLYPNTSPGMGLWLLHLTDEEESAVNEFIARYRESFFHPESELEKI